MTNSAQMPPSDDRILEFSELLQGSRSRVFGFIYSLVLNMADTEDLFQQTATLLWEKFDEYKPGTDFTSWALRVARFKSANFLRSRYREQSRFSSVVIEKLFELSSTSAETEQKERLDVLAGCLGKLSESDQSLIKKCYAGDMQIKEIAAQEGKKANAMYATLHRIRRNLLDCMRNTLAVDDGR